MGNLSKNFDKEEFACKCGCGLCNVSTKLVKALQRLRDKLGMPITINSACRCDKHNKAVGGVAGSQHTKGTAADIRVEHCSSRDIALVAETIPEFKTGGIGEYKSFVHLDVRGKAARWEGKY